MIPHSARSPPRVQRFLCCRLLHRSLEVDARSPLGEACRTVFDTANREQQMVDNRNSKAEQCSGVPKGQPYQSPGRRQGELCEPWRSPGLRTLSARSPNGTALRSNAFSSDSRARLRFCLGPPRCGCRRLGICTQGGVNVRCARVSLPWALLGIVPSRLSPGKPSFFAGLRTAQFGRSRPGTIRCSQYAPTGLAGQFGNRSVISEHLGRRPSVPKGQLDQSPRTGNSFVRLLKRLDSTRPRPEPRHRGPRQAVRP